LERTVNETSVVDALSWGEAEARISQEASMFVKGEFEVVDIKKAVYKEVFFTDNPNADKWYKCKLQFITLDEKTMKEKRSNVIYLVQAGNIDEAKANIDEAMHGTMIDYEVISVVEKKFMDVYVYSACQKSTAKRNTPCDGAISFKDNAVQNIDKNALKAMKNLEDSVPQGCKLSISTNTGKTVVEFDKTEAKGGNPRDD